MIIAGKPVIIGDHLYHLGLQAWGRITEVDASGSMVFDIGGREFLANRNGMIQGKRQLYWHEPLVLDLPTNDLGPVQRILDAVLKEMKLGAEQ